MVRNFPLLALCYQYVSWPLLNTAGAEEEEEEEDEDKDSFYDSRKPSLMSSMGKCKQPTVFTSQLQCDMTYYLCRGPHSGSSPVGAEQVCSMRGWWVANNAINR